MKKKLITIAAVGCFALLTAAYTFFSTETNQANSLMLENIEALADNEIGSGRVDKHCAGDSHPEEYGCYADNHGADCKKQGDCRR